MGGGHGQAGVRLGVHGRDAAACTGGRVQPHRLHRVRGCLALRIIIYNHAAPFSQICCLAACLARGLYGSVLDEGGGKRLCLGMAWCSVQCLVDGVSM